MTFSAYSYVVSVCTIFESWRLLRRLVADFRGGLFGCVLRLVCGGASSNLRRQLRRRTSELFAAAYLVACCSFLLRRLVYFAVAITAADAWNGAAVNVAANNSAAIYVGVLTNVRRRLRRQTRGRLLGCVLWLFRRCLVEFAA